MKDRLLAATQLRPMSILSWIAGCLLAAWLASGCASPRPSDEAAVSPDPFTPPATPPFLTGPLAVILTNTGGFSARVSLQSGVPSDSREATFGDLLVHGSRLFYVPIASQASQKHLNRAGIRFMWDVAQNGGWILSEGLQGYAPINPTTHITNVASTTSRSATEPVGGHKCKQEDVVVTLSDGSTAVYRVWRAPDLKGVPIQITSLGSTAPLLLKLTKLRLETPPEELFQPPDSFTRYSNLETFMSELVMREQSLREKPASGRDSGPPGGLPARPR